MYKIENKFLLFYILWFRLETKYLNFYNSQIYFWQNHLSGWEQRGDHHAKFVKKQLVYSNLKWANFNTNQWASGSRKIGSWKSKISGSKGKCKRKRERVKNKMRWPPETERQTETEEESHKIHKVPRVRVHTTTPDPKCCAMMMTWHYSAQSLIEIEIEIKMNTKKWNLI